MVTTAAPRPTPPHSEDRRPRSLDPIALIALAGSAAPRGTHRPVAEPRHPLVHTIQRQRERPRHVLPPAQNVPLAPFTTNSTLARSVFPPVGTRHRGHGDRASEQHEPDEHDPPHCRVHPGEPTTRREQAWGRKGSNLRPRDYESLRGGTPTCHFAAQPQISAVWLPYLRIHRDIFGLLRGLFADQLGEQLAGGSVLWGGPLEPRWLRLDLVPAGAAPHARVVQGIQLHFQRRSPQCAHTGFEATPIPIPQPSCQRPR